MGTTEQMRRQGGGSSSSLLGTLRRTVKKVRFLLSFSATRWILSSIRGPTSHRRLSFGSRQPSLLDAADASTPSAQYYCRTASLGAPSTEGADDDVQEDIDWRAEQFIANFYRHIQMERQVSLELRYCREGSLERSTTPPVSFS